MKPKSDKQRLALIKRRNSGLNDAATKDPGFSCQGKVGLFISFYLRCELFATRLQHYYQLDKGYKKTKLNIDKFKKAIKHFNIFLENKDCDLIYVGGTGKRGKKSARQLRNGYLHQLSESDKQEIIQKNYMLLKIMNKILNLRISKTNDMTAYQ